MVGKQDNGAITHIGQLTPDAKNLNKGTVRGLAMLEDSLQQLGAGRSILIDRNGKIIAGNKTVGAAAGVGLEDLLVVDSDGTKLIAVRRTDLDLDTDPRAKRLAIVDNRSSEVGLDWDVERLAELAASDKDLLDGLFTDVDLAKLGVNGGGIPIEEGELSPADEAQSKWQCKLGDLWDIPSKATPGKNHRLLCGDSANAEAVRRLMQGERAGLMATDPPYGVDYVEKARDMNQRGYGHSRAKRSAAIQSDEEMPALDLMRAVFEIALRESLLATAGIYCWYGDQPAEGVLTTLSVLGILHHQNIIWVKDGFVIGRCNYQIQHENCYYGWRRGKRPPFYGESNQTTVWQIDRDQARSHPTQKPVALFTSPMTNHLLAGEIAYEPFAGSGTAFVAAEQTGRLCYGMEIVPAYTAVVLQRLNNMGLSPRLVESAVGS